MPPIFEYQFGVFVEAEDEHEAWEKVRPISEALDRLDTEGESAVEGPWEVASTSDGMMLWRK